MVLYVDFDTAAGTYVAICDNGDVIKLAARSIAEADAEADLLEDESVIHDEC